MLGTLDVPYLEGMYEMGYSADLRAGAPAIQVLGDTAVSTGYITGSMTVPNVGVQAGTWRYTVVWAKGEGGSKVIHWHHSPLVAEMMTMGGEEPYEREVWQEHAEREGDEAEEDMPGAIIVVRHTVEDWEHWAEAFKDHAGMRAEYGSRGAHVFRNVDNPNDLVLALEWGNLEAAIGFGNSENLREAMVAAGVVGMPDIWYFNTEHTRPVLDVPDVKLNADTFHHTLFVRHKVENLERWLGAFEAHGDMRAEYGSKGGYVQFHPYERDDVIAFLGWKGLERAREFVASDTLKEAMQDAGVADEPTVLFLELAFEQDR